LITAFGPRGTILLSHVICVIGWVMTISSLTVINLLTGRALTGMYVGIVSVSATTYSSECFPSRSAARPVVYTALGVLCVYLAGSLLSYSQTATIIALTTVASFVLVRLFVPESPAWLESRGRVGDAEYSKLRLKVATAGASATAVPSPSFFRHINRPDVYRPFLALCLHLVLQQLSGPLVIISYAAELVGDSGIRVLNSYFIAIVLAAFLVIGSFVSTAMDHRESTTILSSTGIMVAGLVIAAYNLGRRLFLNRLGSQLLSFIPLMGLIMFIMSSSVALVPNLPVKNTPGEHVALAFSYVVAFSVIKSYPYVHAYLGWWVFAFFAVAAALNVVYDVLMFSEPKSSNRSAAAASTQSSSVGPAV
jgi:MFS family permease